MDSRYGGKVIILPETTKNPISFCGEVSGTCYGSDISNQEKNFKRGLDCLRSGHGRVLEYPQIYLVLDGWSAKVMREWYVHIISVSRLQASTRYINYKDFDYVVPPSIQANDEALTIYENCIFVAQNAISRLEEIGIPKEDFSGLLPLNYRTQVVCRIGLRELINMSNQRLCSRAYHEYRLLMKTIIEKLSEYGDEWKDLVEKEKVFVPKCEVVGFCSEKKSCGRAKRRDNNND